MTSPNVIQSFSGEHAFLSNFYHATVAIEAVESHLHKFRTNEHAFQACKAECIESSTAKHAYLRRMLELETPQEAKQFGREVKIDLDKWERIKVDSMRRVVFEKFAQNNDLRRQLLETGHALLVEGNTWGDKFWGRYEGKGYNILGAILMETRGYYIWNSRGNGFAPLSDCTYPCLPTG